MAAPGSGVTGQPKRKEIYKYEAPWTVFSMNWSVRPDKRCAPNNSSLLFVPLKLHCNRLPSGSGWLLAVSWRSTTIRFRW